MSRRAIYWDNTMGQHYGRGAPDFVWAGRRQETPALPRHAMNPCKHEVNRPSTLSKL